MAGSPKKRAKELWRDEYVQMTYDLSLMMYTDDEQAKYFGVTRALLNQWDLDHPDFKAARLRGKEPADAPVVAALRSRAMGYEHPEEKLFLDRNGEVVRAETTRRYAPDPTSIGLWLTNRHPEKWKLRGNGSVHDSTAPGAEIRISGGLPDGDK